MIGVFDSGFGGLVVLREFLQVLPQYDYLYLGDNARIPYGTRSDRVVIRFTEQAVDYLFRQGCRLIVLACHTASARALRRIQQVWLPARYPGLRVLGVLIPTVEEAVARTRLKRIGVIATEGTVASQSFELELKKLDPEVEVVQQAGLRESRRYHCDARGCFGTFFTPNRRVRVIYGLNRGHPYAGAQVWPQP